MKNIATLLLSLGFLASGIASAQKIHPHFWDGVLHVKMKAKYVDALPAFAKGKDRLTSEAYGNFYSIYRDFELTSVKKATRSQRPELRPYYEVRFAQPTRVYDLIKRLSAFGEIELVEQVAIMRACQSPPNDLNNNQWFLNNINAVAAWNVTEGSAEIKIAIVDDAVRITHSDLGDNVWINEGEIPNNNFDDDGNGYTDDYKGYDAADTDANVNPPSSASNTNFTHGTHCAGIASAVTNNGNGIAAIAYNCKIIPVKCKGDSDVGENIPYAYQGVEYAIAAGADVISMSWGGPEANSLLQSLMNAAYNDGIVVVAAAGNDNTNANFYPAAYNHVISVGATDNQDRKANFSNYGTTVDVMAPGQGIYSTLAGSNNAYGQMSGTSMACPLVAGLCGLMLAHQPNMTPEQLEECLKSTCTNIDEQNTSFIGFLGAGRINAEAAVSCVPVLPQALDAAIVQIFNPGGFICDPVVQPKVRLMNKGLTLLTKVKILYGENGQTPNVFEWSGFLDQGQGETVTLPPITLTGGPDITFKVYTQEPNGQTDQNSQNDQSMVNVIVLPPPITPPFTENFESNGFTQNHWNIVNPDGDKTWEIAPTTGSQTGAFSARVYVFEYSTRGQRDGLVSPVIDLTNYQDVNLSFMHAYRRYQQNFKDSLIIYISTDCGATFNKRIFANGGGPGFATGPIIGNVDFSPQGDVDWCGGGGTSTECFDVNLNFYAGKKIVLKFEIYNDYGNNLYLDNINLTGTYVTDRNETIVRPEIRLSPNPTDGLLRVTVPDGGSTYRWTLRDALGREAASGAFFANQNENALTLPASVSNGVYTFTLEGANQVFTRKLSLQK